MGTECRDRKSGEKNPIEKLEKQVAIGTECRGRKMARRIPI